MNLTVLSNRHFYPIRVVGFGKVKLGFPFVRHTHSGNHGIHLATFEGLQVPVEAHWLELVFKVLVLGNFL